MVLSKSRSFTAVYFLHVFVVGWITAKSSKTCSKLEDQTVGGNITFCSPLSDGPPSCFLKCDPGYLVPQELRETNSYFHCNSTTGLWLPNIKPHCIEIDECQSSPCIETNSFSCMDMVNSFQCKCRPGFTGSTCETEIYDCSKHECQNNGTCIAINNTSYECDCAENLHGTFCSEVAGVWTSWSKWTSCSVSCDRGSKSRQRYCHVIANMSAVTDIIATPICKGEGSVKEDCYGIVCPNYTTATRNATIASMAVIDDPPTWPIWIGLCVGMSIAAIAIAISTACYLKKKRAKDDTSPNNIEDTHQPSIILQSPNANRPTSEIPSRCVEGNSIRVSVVSNNLYNVCKDEVEENIYENLDDYYADEYLTVDRTRSKTFSQSYSCDTQQSSQGQNKNQLVDDYLIPEEPICNTYSHNYDSDNQHISEVHNIILPLSNNQSNYLNIPYQYPSNNNQPLSPGSNQCLPYTDSQHNYTKLIGKMHVSTNSSLI